MPVAFILKDQKRNDPVWRSTKCPAFLPPSASRNMMLPHLQGVVHSFIIHAHRYSSFRYAGEILSHRLTIRSGFQQRWVWGRGARQRNSIISPSQELRHIRFRRIHDKISSERARERDRASGYLDTMRRVSPVELLTHEGIISSASSPQSSRDTSGALASRKGARVLFPRARN